MVCEDLGALLLCLQAVQPLELSQNGALAAGGDKMLFIFALFVATFSGCCGHTIPPALEWTLVMGQAPCLAPIHAIFSFHPYGSTEGWGR